MFLAGSASCASGAVLLRYRLGIIYVVKFRSQTWTLNIVSFIHLALDESVEVLLYRHAAA